MMRFFRKIHLWLSVPFGIIISLICFSGATLVFEPEITRAIKSDVYKVSDASGTPLPMGEVMENVKASLPDSVSITGVTVFSDPSRTWQVNLSKPRRASVFVNQYTGEVTGRYERLGFFSTMFKLHRWLLDSANPHGDGVKVGKLLVGISTLIFVIALITGIIIWWPRARKGLAGSLSISFKKGWKGFWKGLHVAGGMWTVIIILAMALTGLTWSFNWYRSAFYAVCGVEHKPRNMEQPTAVATTEGRGEGRGEGHGGFRRSQFGRWQEVYNELKAQNPDAPQITIGPETASVTISAYGNPRAADKYEFNRRSGEITPSSAYAEALPADKLRGWIYSIHTGSLGGLITRILWCFAALLGATLPLTGYYIWIYRLVMKKKGIAHAHH